jgi:cobalt-zinc-cadmium resistance protein CzcA
MNMSMIDRLIGGSLRNRSLVVVGVLLLAGLGIWSFIGLPIDAFPDVTNIQVEVLSSAPGMSPFEVEKFVTHPLEMAMRGLPRLNQLRSVSFRLSRRSSRMAWTSTLPGRMSTSG